MISRIQYNSSTLLISGISFLCGLTPRKVFPRLTPRMRWEWGSRHGHIGHVSMTARDVTHKLCFYDVLHSQDGRTKCRQPRHWAWVVHHIESTSWHKSTWRAQTCFSTPIISCICGHFVSAILKPSWETTHREIGESPLVRLVGAHAWGLQAVCLSFQAVKWHPKTLSAANSI